MKKLLSRVKRRVVVGKDSVEVDGSVLPAPDLRYCGPEFKDDTFYLGSAEHEARRLVEHFGCTEQSRVLDVGCGQGRLPIGLTRVVGELSYVGVDVDLASVQWCERRLAARHPTLRFVHLDVENERYNKGGESMRPDFRFDLPDAAFDIAYLFSVFSHMTERDMRIYLTDFRRLLAPGGHLFFTTFVEEGVPEVSVNPEGYTFESFSGPLHVVRYDKAHLYSLLEGHGYRVQHFTHRTEADGQSALYLESVA